MTEYRPRDDKGRAPKPRPRSGQSSSRARAQSPSGSGRTRKAGPQSRTNKGAVRQPARRGPARPPKRGRGALRTVGLILLVAFAALGITAGIVYATLASSLPDPDVANGRGRDQSSVILDRKGRVLAKLYAEENRSDKKLADIPPLLRRAAIATEDKRFYEHTGVDPLGIARAVVTDIALRKKAQGGSTITQQYVKQAFVTDEKTLKRKVMEAMLANRIEKRHSKDEILELYLNTIYFGHGSYGVESAARAYFGKGVEEITLPEAAMIAGVIKSPGRYSPYLDPEAAKRRRDTVLGQMLDQGYITASEHEEAVTSPIKTTGLKRTATRAPYFVEWIKAQLAEKYGQDRLYRGGLRVKTTLDMKMQTSAEKSIAAVLNRKNDPSAAIVSIRPGTGEVLAMVGGRDFKTQQFNAAVQGAGRQPGSAFKPFVLTTALTKGVSPSAAFESGPVKLRVGDETWSVTGAHGGRKGPMRLREATEQSVNSVFAQLILDVTPEEVVKTAERMGLPGDITPVPAIALGGLETGVTPLEMANAYATLAAEGQVSTPFGISEVKDSEGKVIFSAKRKSKEALDPAVAYLTTDLLKGVITRGTGTAAAIGRPAAGKTGTTQENRDAWFVGYTPQLATAVWMGYPEGAKAMNNVHGQQVTGGSFPAQIWARFMKAALSGQPVLKFEKPSGLKTMKVCNETGQAATEYCPRKINELMLTSTKLEPCKKHALPEQIKIPNLVGLTKEAALAALDKLKLAARVVEQDVAGVSAGTVAKQSPGKGSVATSATVVNLTVSNGGAGDQAPVPDLKMPATASPGEKVTLDGSGSTDNGKIVTWYWEFGDGTNVSGKKVTHAWAVNGPYDVTLWVTDDSGQQASISKHIVIK